MLENICLRSAENWSFHIHEMNKNRWVLGDIFELKTWPALWRGYLDVLFRVWETSSIYFLERARISGTHPLMFKSLYLSSCDKVWSVSSSHLQIHLQRQNVASWTLEQWTPHNVQKFFLCTVSFFPHCFAVLSRLIHSVLQFRTFFSFY